MEKYVRQKWEKREFMDMPTMVSNNDGMMAKSITKNSAA